MIIINADDWGRSEAETDIALRCFKAGRITSVTGMVFMSDSQRAAQLANDNRLDVGLHLNLSQPFTGPVNDRLNQQHRAVTRFMRLSKYSQLVYNPFIRGALSQVFQAQYDEFVRLYGKAPSHVDGHQHRHLCSNMLIDPVIPSGTKVRRSFSFFPGEKSSLNRLYRRWVDGRLSRRYRLTEFFFSLSRCLRNQSLDRVWTLAREAAVELMTHPIVAEESSYLLSDAHAAKLAACTSGSFARL